MANEQARALWKRLTDAEMRMWFRLRPLRGHGLKFRRQSPIGRYIVDFECRTAKVVVEVDGGGHAKPETIAHDGRRDKWLAFRGYRVLRFWNDEVIFHTDDVIDHIVRVTQERLEQPQPR